MPAIDPTNPEFHATARDPRETDKFTGRPVSEQKNIRAGSDRVLHNPSCQAATVTPEDIELWIQSVRYEQPQGTMTTIAVVTLLNGHTILGEAHCINPATFSQHLGEEYSLADAKSKMWPLLGFLLRTDLWRQKQRSSEAPAETLSEAIEYIRADYKPAILTSERQRQSVYRFRYLRDRGVIAKNVPWYGGSAEEDEWIDKVWDDFHTTGRAAKALPLMRPPVKSDEELRRSRWLSGKEWLGD